MKGGLIFAEGFSYSFQDDTMKLDLLEEINTESSRGGGDRKDKCAFSF